MTTLFEVSWEVCNKVGGIYTVIATKALYLKNQLGRHHIMIGPDVWMHRADNPDFIEDTVLYRSWRLQAAAEGIRVRIGRWNVPGRPVAILVDYKQFLPDFDRILGEYWKRFGVDSLTGDWDYKENALFGYASGKVIGTATTDGNRTVYRDASGKVTGTATTNGNKTTYRDSSGRTTGTATENGNRTTFRDSSGKTTGTATTNGNRTTFREATGASAGSATSTENRTTYRDAHGSTVGTSTSTGTASSASQTPPILNPTSK